MFTIFQDDGNFDDAFASLKKTWRYSANKSLLPLRNFSGISISWTVFFEFNFFNPLIMHFVFD